MLTLELFFLLKRIINYFSHGFKQSTHTQLDSKRLCTFNTIWRNKSQATYQSSHVAASSS